MGASGAGKTTLMDVLADRKTGLPPALVSCVILPSDLVSCVILPSALVICVILLLPCQS